MADGTLIPPEGEQIKLVINRMTEEQYQQLVALSAEYLSTELSNQLFLTDGGKPLPGQYKTYDETVTALTSQSGFKTYAQTSAQLSNDGYATQEWVHEQGFAGSGIQLSDVQATIFDFGNGDLSAFGWEGEITYQNLVAAGIKSSIERVEKQPVYVKVGNRVADVGFAAFYNCSGLSSVTIPDSVTSIGSGAFYGCSSLTSVPIPNSITSIKNGAFQGCSGLSNVTIPASVTSIGGSAFSGCSQLTEIKVEGKTRAEAEALLADASVPAGCQIKTWNFQPAGGSGSYISQSQLASAILSAGRVPDGDGSNLQNAISVLNALIDALSALTT